MLDIVVSKSQFSDFSTVSYTTWPNPYCLGCIIMLLGDINACCMTD